MCNAVKLPSAPRLKFQNPGQNYSKSEEAKIKILLDNDPQTKITGIMYFNLVDFENWNQLEIEVGHLLVGLQKGDVFSFKYHSFSWFGPLLIQVLLIFLS